jgi:hypothetical protein
LSASILAIRVISVVAITGKESERDYLTNLGAKEIILRSDFENLDKRPILKPLFAGGIYC